MDRNDVGKWVKISYGSATVSRNAKSDTASSMEKSALRRPRQNLFGSRFPGAFLLEENMRRRRWLLAALVLAICLTACGDKSTGAQSEGQKNVQDAPKESVSELPIEVEGADYPLVIRDYIKQETELKEMPKKVAVLSGTPLNIWYDLGGKSICTSDISSNVRLVEGYEDEIKALPTIGPVYSIDMESVIPLKPDLVIAQTGTQSVQGKKLKEMGFPTIMTHIRSLEDVISYYRGFGKILGKEELAEQKIRELTQKKEEIVSKLPKERPSVVILYFTNKTIAAKLDRSIAGDVAKILGFENIAADLPADSLGSENTPLDVEYIVKKDPDYVFVTSMVESNELAEEMIRKEFETNPVWKGVRAIQEGKVHHLPQEYFLYNAGPYYDEAIRTMARCVYPEVFGE